MGCSDQGYDHLTIYVAACPRVGLFRFRCEASGYALKRRLRLHTKETSHRDDKGVEAVALQKKTQDTSSSSISLPYGGTSTATCFGERGRQCSRHACRKYCSFLYAIGRGLAGIPSASMSL